MAEGLKGLFLLAVWVGIWWFVASKGKKSGWGALKRQLSGAFTGIFGMFIVAGFIVGSGSGEGTAAAPAASAQKVEDSPESVIRKIDKNISDVKVYQQGEGTQPLLLITYTDSTIWSDASWMSGTGLALERILGHIAKEMPFAYSRVQVKFMVPTVDKYGNQSTGFAMRTEHAMSELRKVNWDNAHPFMMLNLAEAEIKPLGLAGFRDYCAEYGKDSPTFCARVR